ncbi:PhoH family protein [Candidatus Finniella inopinata]|nr:PhoH family protein [Candidatus Finniella inopinata]
MSLRGNCITLEGDSIQVVYAEKAVLYLYEQLKKRQSIGISELDHALQLTIRQVTANQSDDSDSMLLDQGSEISIVTKRRIVFPRNPHQTDYVQAMQANELVFGIGPAGTGKTYLAVAQAVSLLLEGKIDRIILSRPAVEAGERLGFLPGDLKEKVDPYLRPLYDALHDLLPAEQVIKHLSSGVIEVAPLAFMRGRTLSHAFVILDEAQNATAMQMKMLLTRLGPHSRMVVNGDLTQIDLPGGVMSGLRHAMQVLHAVSDIPFIVFDDNDVVRHPLVAKIVKAYNAYDQKGNESRG